MAKPKLFYLAGQIFLFVTASLILAMPHFTHHSEENYLKTLYKLNNKQVKKLNNVTLAKALDLNPATVLEMVRKLAKKNLLEILPDKSLQLTDKGKKRALQTIRKHRLWEVFLVEKLQYKWNEVHELAEQLEHIESSSLTDRLETYLGYPLFDPHGDPIPDKNGKVKSNPCISLSTGEKGQTYKVISLAETSDVFLSYLEKLNIKPGSKLKIADQHEYDQSLSILVKKNLVQLTEKAASNILVQLLLNHTTKASIQRLLITSDTIISLVYHAFLQQSLAVQPLSLQQLISFAHSPSLMHCDCPHFLSSQQD